MIEEMSKELAAEIRRSREYEAYAAAKEKVLADEQTAGLLKRFHKLQMTVQARKLAGGQGGAEEEELKKLAELLQFSPDAADYLLAEYGLNRLLTNTYDTIARLVGVDFTEWSN
ncbi:MAG: YlbF family regulator [Clostridia bacterium]|nr:YlbF family regulator [Clostridia bacterium]MBR0357141.1 YlbF family regulator [Clostridia bacterium]